MLGHIHVGDLCVSQANGKVFPRPSLDFVRFTDVKAPYLAAGLLQYAQ